MKKTHKKIHQTKKHTCNRNNKTKTQQGVRVGGNNKIKILTSGMVASFTGIVDLTNYTNLTELNISENKTVTGFTNIPNTVIKIIINNTNIKTIDRFPDGLKELQCTNMQKNTVEHLLSHLPPNLEILHVNKNGLTGRFISFLPPNIKELQCSENKITEIHVPPSLYKLNCVKNELTSIYFDPACILMKLQCDMNPELTHIDILPNTLTQVSAIDTPIEFLIKDTQTYRISQKHELYMKMKHRSINDTLTRGGRLDLGLPLFWNESPIVEDYLTYLLHHRPEIMDEIQFSINNSIKNGLQTNRLNCVTAIRFFMENHLFDENGQRQITKLSVLFTTNDGIQFDPFIENRNIAIYLFGIMPENEVNAIYNLDTKETYLLHACKYNDVELAECIVSRLRDNATLHKKDDFGYDAVYYAKQFRMKHVLHQIHELDEKTNEKMHEKEKETNTEKKRKHILPLPPPPGIKMRIENGWNPIDLQYVDIHTWLLSNTDNIVLSFHKNTIVSNYPAISICISLQDIATIMRQPSVYVKECVYIKDNLLDYGQTSEPSTTYISMSSLGIVGMKHPMLMSLESIYKLKGGEHIHATKQKTIRGISEKYILHHPSSHGFLVEGEYMGFATKQSLSLTNYSKHWDIAMNAYLRNGPNYFLSDEFLKYHRRFGKNVDEARENVLKNIENIDMAFTYAPRTGDLVTVFRGTKNKQSDAPYTGVQSGFISTTANEDILEMGDTFISLSDKCCVYVYTVEAGIPYISMNKLSHYSEEDEILFPRGLIVTVDDTEITEDGFKKYLCTIHMPEDIQERYPLKEKCIIYDAYIF